MEVSVVRQQVTAAIERAKQTALAHRARVDELSHAYDSFLPDVAVPLFRQIASVLKAGGYPFTVSTPGGSVKLGSDKNSGDAIEVVFDAAGDEPRVLLRSTRTRGRRVLEKERPITTGSLASLADEHLLAVVLEELEPFLAR